MQDKLRDRLQELETLKGLFKTVLDSYTEAASLFREYHSDLEWDNKAKLEGVVQQSREMLIDIQRRIDECSGPTILLRQLASKGGE